MSDEPKTIRELRNEYVAGRKTGVIGSLRQAYVDAHPVDPNRKPAGVQRFNANDPTQNATTMAGMESKYGRGDEE